MEMPESVANDLHKRLRRVEGQIRGIQAMIDDGRECREIVTQISAAGKALDQVGFKMLAAGLAACIQDPNAINNGGPTQEELEKLFLKLS